MARGKYPRVISNREKIFKLTEKIIPLTRKRKNGTEYLVSPKPICSECKIPVRNLYLINQYYRKMNVSRYEHVAYYCPGCKALFPRKLVDRKVEEFNGDTDG